jgi:hypothetical protein
MFGSEIIDTAIGLVFVFLLVSVLVTVVNEMIAAMLLSRAKWLEYGIARLIGSTWADQLYAHPLIEGGFAAGKIHAITDKLPLRGSGPSYLPSRAFADVLIHLVVEQDKWLPPIAAAITRVTRAGSDPKDFPTFFNQLETEAANLGDEDARVIVSDLVRTLRAKAGSTKYNVADAIVDVAAFVDAMPLRYLGAIIDRLPDTDRIKQPMKLLLREAHNDIDHFKESIEIWFNNAMDRVSGWYKRRSQWVAFAVGLVSAVALNVDTLGIGAYLQTHAGVRDAVVAKAKAYAAVVPPTTINADDPAAKQFQVVQDGFARTRADLDALALPIGWFGADPATARDAKTLLWSHWVGWLITALAATLGAPFWFDMLNRIISIRSSGKAPEETPRPPKAQPVPLAPGEEPEQAAVIAAIKQAG